MSAPTFSQSNRFATGSNGSPLISVVGVLALDGSKGATAGDVPASLFGLTTITGVSGGLNTGGSQFIQFVPSPTGTSLLSLNDAGVPTDAPSDSYAVTLIGN